MRPMGIWCGLVLLLGLLIPARGMAQSGVTDRSATGVTCASDDGRRHYCPLNTSRGVQLTKQRSGSPCIQGQTWGYDRRGVWVDRGCRAEFAITGYGPGGPGFGGPGGPGGPGFGGPGGPGGGQVVTCSSNDGRRTRCGADTSRGVQLVNQRSGSPCVQGQTWGYDQRGIWVDRGCRADFAVGRR